MNAFRILLADDHPIFRFGLRALFASREGWEVCGESDNGRDTIEMCARLKPDLVILDICMPSLNGVDAARQVLRDNPAQRILVLTDVSAEQVVRDCLEAGVRGWVFKSDRTEDLTTAVEAMQQHKSIFSPRVSDLIVDAYQGHRLTPTVANLPKLTPREREVVQLLAGSKSVKEVAITLNMSVKTAETHRSNLMRKLKLHSVTELVLYAVRNEIIHVHVPLVATLPQPGKGQADDALLRVN